MTAGQPPTPTILYLSMCLYLYCCSIQQPPLPSEALQFLPWFSNLDKGEHWKMNTGKCTVSSTCTYHKQENVVEQGNSGAYILLSSPVPPLSPSPLPPSSPSHTDCQQQEILQLVVCNLDQRELYYLATLLMVRHSLVPTSSHRPVFDHLQYAKTEGEGLVYFIT